MKPVMCRLLVLLIVVLGGRAEASAASVTLAWDGAPGQLYRVYYGTKPGVYTKSVDARERHSVVIDGLAENQVYYFAVRAYDTAGNLSPFSAEIRKLATQSPAERRAMPPPTAGPAAPKPNATAAQVSVMPPAVRTSPAPAPVTPPDRKEPAPATAAPPDPKTDAKTDPKTDATAGVNAAPARKETATAASNGAPPATPPASASPAPRVPPPPRPATVAGPPGYLIGPNDVLSVTFWRDKDMSVDSVVVRPDGNITLPLLNDIQAAGSTPEQLRDRILAAAERYLEDPSPTVAVKEIHSRMVFITGQVDKPGAYPMAAPMTVLQLIAMAGGLKEFADGKNIVVMRSENGRQLAFQFDYRELLKGRNFRQNIDLKPGDTVVVP